MRVPTSRPGRRRRAVALAVAAAAAVAAPPAAAATHVLSVDDVEVSEGDSGTREAVFTVTLLPAHPLDAVTVDYFTANDTAVAPADYAAAAGTLVFPPGATEATVAVAVAGDRVDEATETFGLRLTGAVNAAVADGVGIATIVDDDLTPRLTVDDVSVAEDREAHFTVRLFPAADREVTVEVTTANGTATSPDDYEDLARMLVFSPGETTETVTVHVHDDDVDEEPEETFFLELSGATGGAVVADDEGTGTIEDDDARSWLTIDDVEVVEGDSGTRDAVFTVRLFPASDERVTVEYATENDEAVAPDDYESEAGVLVFEAGETTKRITVEVRGDRLDERDSGGDDDDDDDNGGDGEDENATRETFVVNLSGAVNADIADDEGECDIIDDDLLPVLTIDSPTVKEGDGGRRDLRFTVRLFPAAAERVTVHYATVDDTARAGEDYRPESGTLIFSPGEERRTITVEVDGDRLDEPDETFVVLLHDAVNAPLEEDEGEGTIADDDLAPALGIDDVTVLEGDRGESEATVRVRLSAPSGWPVTFEIATEDGSATSPDDYTATSGTITLAPGETVVRFDVPVQGDDEEEDGDEEFTVAVTEAEHASVARAEATVVVVEDDGAVAPRVAMAPTPSGRGYWLATADGDVYAFGDARYHGGLDEAPNRPVVAMAPTRDGRGYWLVAADGGVFAFGNARFFGSTGHVALNQPIVGIAPTPAGRGYWLVAADGGIFAFGDAGFFGSTGGFALRRPVVAMAPAADGRGYWLVAGDGGVFTFGSARFFGSTGGTVLNRPIVGMAAAPDGRGYWLVAADGGIFAFGGAGFFGSTGALMLNQPIVAMAPAAVAAGYWLLAADGGIFAFGDAGFFGSTGGARLRA